MALFKRKDKENKKGSENAIGKIIYGFLLFMPLLSIGARCLYVILNKNANQSYSADQSLTYRLIDNQSTLSADVQYQYQTNRDIYNSATLQYIYVKDFKTVTSTTLPNNITRFRVYYNGNNQSYSLEVGGDTTVYLSYGNYTNPSNLVINFISDREQTNTNYLTNIYKFDYSTQQSLDNVFEYSINQTQESTLYNWAKDTGTYTVLHNTTTGIGITNEFIPMLMAYWLIISVIYFLFDIALILIWAVHKKIHELSEAI